MKRRSKANKRVGWGRYHQGDWVERPLSADMGVESW